ncbi:MAG: tetrahydrofolate dehydrogenase/cyclohydrolase catalytic domain-containing protein [Bacillales bacterium]
MIEIYKYCQDKKDKIKKIIQENNFNINLYILMTTDNPASQAYVRGKLKDCDEVGIHCTLLKDTNYTFDSLKDTIINLNNLKDCYGIIVQLPLKEGIDYNKIKLFIDPKKDVDGFHPMSKYIPATPFGIISYLRDNNYEFCGKNCVILGRSEIVGKPLHNELLKLNMNVINLHSKTSDSDRRFYLAHADLIVVAIGKKYYLDSSYTLKKDAIIIDVGINRIDNKLYGDCEPNLSVKYQTPVPKGVGLLTRLALLNNLLISKNIKNEE